MLFLERGHFGKINCKGECLRKEKREIGNSVRFDYLSGPKK